MIKLLLIEDDINLSFIIKSNLEEILGGYEIVTATNGEEGIQALKEYTPDIIVSDIDMPVLDGIEMVKRIRQVDKNMPILFATGKSTTKDVVAGYGSGADNYIKKPFLPEELDAHIKALLNLKRGQARILNKTVYQIGHCIFDPSLYLIKKPNDEKKLTAREAKILALLCENKGEVVFREDILTQVWGTNDYFTSRSLDVFISKLRSYLSEESSVSISNIKGVGLVIDYAD